MGLYNLKAGEARLLDLKDGAVALGIPVGMDSKQYYVDFANGSDGNGGTSPDKAMKTLKAAYDLCVTGHNDSVLVIPSATANEPAAAIDWSKSYTHLIGLSAPMPGMGQRCRVEGTAALDLAYLVDFQGSGCIVKNIKFQNLSDASGIKGGVIVSGGRNYFENVFIGGMGHATNGAVAGAYSLSVSGEENCFVDCVIGTDTILRAAVNWEMVITGTRNRFIHCEFRSHSVTAGKFLVRIDAGVGGDIRDIIFENCLFYNFTTNWATGITDAFNMVNGATHSVVLRGDNMLVGVTSWADTYTHLYSAQAAPGAGFGISGNPST